MQVFTRVVECGTFSGAAESLDLANATVTSSIHNLEKHLGVTLIQRNTRSLRLTDEGTAFYESALGVLRDVEQAETAVRGKGTSVSGVLRVESPFAFAKCLLCPVVSRFTDRNPGVSVAMILTDHAQNPIERGTDIAIYMDHVSEVGLVARPIYQARYVVCAASAFLEGSPRPSHPREIDERRCLGFLGGGRYVARPWQFSRGDELHEVTPRGPVAYNSSDALIQAALQGEGYIYVLDVFVNSLLGSGALVEVCDDWSTASRTFYAVTPKNRFVPPKVRAFVEFLRESLDAQRRPSPRTQVPIKAARRTAGPKRR